MVAEAEVRKGVGATLAVAQYRLNSRSQSLSEIELLLGIGLTFKLFNVPQP